MYSTRLSGRTHVPALGHVDAETPGLLVVPCSRQVAARARSSLFSRAASTCSAARAGSPGRWGSRRAAALLLAPHLAHHEQEPEGLTEQRQTACNKRSSELIGHYVIGVRSLMARWKALDELYNIHQQRGGVLDGRADACVGGLDPAILDHPAIFAKQRFRNEGPGPTHEPGIPRSGRRRCFLARAH